MASYPKILNYIRGLHFIFRPGLDSFGVGGFQKGEALIKAVTKGYPVIEKRPSDSRQHSEVLNHPAHKTGR